MTNKRKEFQFLNRASALAARFAVLDKTLKSIKDPENFLPMALLESLGHSKEKIAELIQTLTSDSGNAQKWNSDGLGGYLVINDLTLVIMYNDRLEEYYGSLRSNIREAKEIKNELKELLNEVDKRSPHFFKSGNLKHAIEHSISLDQTKELIEFGNEVFTDTIDTISRRRPGH